MNRYKLFVHNKMTFGEWLRKKIKDKDWSNARVARLSGVSPTYIGNLVRDYSPTTISGKGRPSEEVVENIAKALEADVDEARLAAGYAPRMNPDEGFFKGLDRLSPDDQALAKRQIKAIIDSFVPQDDEDDDFDDSKEHRVE